MKCRDMNPGNAAAGLLCLLIASPSMKCRDMNPGNDDQQVEAVQTVNPSMKCRDMNPGNPLEDQGVGSRPPPLNEVPGYESRQ